MFRAIHAAALVSEIGLLRGLYLAQRIRRGGKRIRGASGGRTRNEDCCCGCNCETGGPEAAFSYEQTATSPCTINLFDDSVPGDCGEIVAWSWKVNGVEVSTDQNPTGITVEDGDDVELTVTDTSGCNDAAVGSIVCGVSCANCPDFLPPTCTMQLSGYDKADGSGPCTVINTTHTLNRLGGNSCRYEKDVTCPISGVNMKLVVEFTSSSIIVRLARGGPPVDDYDRARSSSDPCRGTFTCTPNSLFTGGSSSNTCCKNTGATSAIVTV